MRDVEDVKCANVKGDENSDKSVSFNNNTYIFMLQ